MKIHEYQGKEIVRRYGVPVPRGMRAFSVQEAVEAAQQLGGALWAVKAQIHAAGRGAAGGVRLARSLEEVREAARQLLGAPLVTRETGAGGQLVRRLYIEEGVQVQRRFDVLLQLDAPAQCMALAAREAREGAAVARELIDPLGSLDAAQGARLAAAAGVPQELAPQFARICQRLCECGAHSDALRLEVAPLALEAAGRLLALDVRCEFDDHALFRHPEIAALRDLDEEHPDAAEAEDYDIAYRSLGGGIACIANGAGLVQAAADSVRLAGGQAACLLDTGLAATAEKLHEALHIALRGARVRGVLFAIFGGVVRCDAAADGIAAACRDLAPRVPLAVRLNGCLADEGRQRLRAAQCPAALTDSLEEAARRLVAAA